MNSTLLLDALNTTQAYANNGSTTEEITHEEGWENEDGFGDEKGFSRIQIEGTTYMACILIIASLGVVGNVMSFLLMMDAKTGSFSYSIYLKWLAVSDSVLLIMVSTEDTLDTIASLQYFLTYNIAVCKVWTFIKSVTFTLSPWLVVALTLDRFVCIVFPLSRHVFCVRSKAIKLCATLTLVSAAMDLYLLIMIKTEDGECDIEWRSTAIRYAIFQKIVIQSTLPCLAVLVLNTITVIRIRRSISFREQFKQRDASKSIKDKVDRSTLPLLLVSVFAFVTLLPRTVTEVVEFLLDILQTDDDALELANDIWPLFNIIYLLNFALNFYILIASWPEYRLILKRMFCRCQTVKKTSQLSETSGSMAPSVSTTSRETILGSASVSDVEFT